MKKMAVLLLCLLLAVLFGGCSSSRSDKSIILDNQAASSQLKSKGEKKTIALVLKTLTNPFFVELEKGARRAEKEAGDITLLVKTGAKETSIDQQITIVEELIREKVDAIVISPASSTELIPVLKKAQDANIPIINIDNQLDLEVGKKVGLKEIPFISVDNEKGAYLSAKYISDQITVPTEVVILEGIREAKNAQDRKNGALRAFKENSNITVVGVETANWKIDEAYMVVAGLYKSHPSVGAIFCANDMMGLGVVKYLQDKGKPGVLVAAYDALEEAKKAIKNGQMSVTIDQQADMQGYLGIQYALQKIKGESVPPLTLVDVRVITSQNLP